MKNHRRAGGVHRRGFLASSMGVVAASAAGSPLLAFAQDFSAPFGARRRAEYGALFETPDERTGLPLLKLPRGFRYSSICWTKDLLADGTPMPGLPDGGAAFDVGRHRIHYVRNHEIRSPVPGGVSMAPASASFDAGAPGGTSTLVFDTRGQGAFVESYISLGGTLQNCGGGSTPWKTWLSCEESFFRKGVRQDGSVLHEWHGWVFEVPAVGLSNGMPIKGMGRFVHEACAVDPRTSIVYQTEDGSDVGFYRYIPHYYGKLQAGGRLQMLKVKGVWQKNLKNFDGAIRVGSSFDIEWVDISDPEVAESLEDSAVFSQGFDHGGAVFTRLEGASFGNDCVYFDSTSGGLAERGQVWMMNPSNGTLTLVYESPDITVLDSPDNLTVSPAGGVLLCEDGDSAVMYLRGLDRDGRLYDFCANNVNLNGQINGFSGDFKGGEFTGASFSPDGKWLFVSAMSPGITFAITGPWDRGPLG